MVPLSLAQNSPQDYIDAHNAARKQVGVQNMTWDTTVVGYAQNYANTRIDDCNLVHSSCTYGENLAKGSGSFTGTAAVNLWVAEKPYYYYSNNSCVGGLCLNYTQVVWNTSVTTRIIVICIASFSCKNKENSIQISFYIDF
ncbi:hypothetical protein I3843_05G023100 [Carya illinoinensis]|nr:hypothetical protein I3843_05G023100 [Carya illinoinensis]